MRISLCSFSGYKIYPGHGKTHVKADGKVLIFLSSKCEASYYLKRNPRNVTWTVLYRRKHKKGMEVEQVKKKTRRTQKCERAVIGASLSDILAKKNQKPEVRKAMREQAIRAAKEKARAIKEKKKAETTVQKQPAPKPQQKQKIAKVQQKSAPRVGGKR